MNLVEFIERVIGDGINAAKADYPKPDQKEKLKGSISGFEKCRGKNTLELLTLLDEAKIATHKALLEQAKNYWFVRCEEAEIEWVCNCVSALLVNEGFDPIIIPTARSVMKVAEIVGVGEQ